MVGEEMNKIKDVVDSMFEFYEEIGKRTCLNEQIRDVGADFTASGVVKMDMLRFLAYLSASDGVISWNECDYIDDLFDLDLTPQNLNDFILGSNTYTDEFESNPPLSLQILVSIDNAIYEMGSSKESESSSTLMFAYKEIAKGLILSNCDSVDDCDEDLMSDLVGYLNMMDHYINKETKKRHADVIFDGKRKESGVKAPKKNQCKRNDKSDSNDSSESVKAPKKKA